MHEGPVGRDFRFDGLRHFTGEYKQQTGLVIVVRGTAE